MGGNGIANVGLLFIFLCYLRTIQSVGQFAFLIGHFAYVVQQSGALSLFGIEPQLAGHDSTEIGRFAGMLQQVLPIARPVFHLSDDADEFGMKPMNA